MFRFLRSLVCFYVAGDAIEAVFNNGELRMFVRDLTISDMVLTVLAKFLSLSVRSLISFISVRNPEFVDRSFSIAPPIMISLLADIVSSTLFKVESSWRAAAASLTISLFILIFPATTSFIYLT